MRVFLTCAMVFAALVAVLMTIEGSYGYALMEAVAAGILAALRESTL